jgi:hypothetical protein
LVVALAALLLIAGCGSPRSVPELPRDILGKWTRDFWEVDMWQPARTTVMFASDGRGTVGSAVTRPGAVGVSPLVGFSYTCAGDRVTLTFEDGATETLELRAVSRDELRIHALGKSEMVKSGKWNAAR